jgi:acyl transferase domain-containing protein
MVRRPRNRLIYRLDLTISDILVQPLSPEDLKRPEISQSACTAFQIAMLAVLAEVGAKPCLVAGHSSGEIAAAVAAGLLTPEQAIKIAYFRGLATSAVTPEEPLGMLAAGLGAEAVATYLEATSIQIACFNSPASVTLSGRRSELEGVEAKVKADGHFARMLHVTAAYHSRHMESVAAIYKDLLDTEVDWVDYISDETLPMFSSTTGKIVSHPPGAEYWVKNMVSPVLFEQSVSSMIPSADILIEVGPSNALSGPVTQTKTALSSKAEYIPSWKRGVEALQTLLTLGGKLFIAGGPVNLAALNADGRDTRPSVIVDLPNYRWNHSTKYWYENDASRDWRFKKFIYHDLLGSKLLGSPWTRPVFRNRIKMWELPFLRDHKIGESLIFPASGYVVMAVEGMFQKAKTCGRLGADVEIHHVGYALRDIGFLKAFQIDDGDRGTSVLLTLIPETSTPDTWHEFIVSSVTDDVVSDHCRGRISIAADQSKIGKKTPSITLTHQ